MRTISLLLISSLFMAACSSHPARQFEKIVVEAPFPMDTIKVMIYPDKDFPITDYGAVEGGETINTAAIAAAIDVTTENLRRVKN